MTLTILLVTIGVPAAAALLIGVALWRSLRAKAAIEREFRNVYAMTSKDRQEALLKGLMDRKGCTRREAMRLGVEERRNVR